MDDSPFARLPPELRNSIWTLLVNEDTDVDAAESKWIGCSSHTDWLQTHMRFAKLPPIVHTCRQVRAESLSLYYAEDVFVHQLSTVRTQFDSRATLYIAQNFAVWLPLIDPAFRPALRNIKIVVPYGDCQPGWTYGWYYSREKIAVETIYEALQALHFTHDGVNIEVDCIHFCLAHLGTMTVPVSTEDHDAIRVKRLQETRGHVTVMKSEYLGPGSGDRARLMASGD